ncbi:MAG: hypothetical protein LBF86_07795 [Helicobacteraceae bacterium]|nr:hypothetical protein [Helicobacteraceae bacterium]
MPIEFYLSAVDFFGITTACLKRRFTIDERKQNGRKTRSKQTAKSAAFLRAIRARLFLAPKRAI